MAYLLERGLFMAINKPTFHRKPPLSSSLSSYPNAQQILNRKLLPIPVWGEIIFSGKANRGAFWAIL